MNKRHVIAQQACIRPSESFIEILNDNDFFYEDNENISQLRCLCLCKEMWNLGTTFCETLIGHHLRNRHSNRIANNMLFKTLLSIL